MLSTIILTKSDFWPLSLTTHLRYKLPDNPDTDARTHARTHKHRTKNGTATYVELTARGLHKNRDEYNV